jgi:hypothetical protein
MLESLHFIKENLVKLFVPKAFEKLPLRQPCLLGQKVQLSRHGYPVDSQKLRASPQRDAGAQQTIQWLVNAPFELSVGRASRRLRKSLSAYQTPIPHQCSGIRFPAVTAVYAVALAHS